MQRCSDEINMAQVRQMEQFVETEDPLPIRGYIDRYALFPPRRLTAI